MSTYRFVSNAPGLVQFGLVTNSNVKLQIQQTQSSIGSGINRVPILRNTFSLRTPMTVDLNPDSEGLNDRALATRLVEIRTSAPMLSKALILADLAELYRIVSKSNDDYAVYDGFLPPFDATFTA